MPHPRGSEWRRWDLHVHTPASIVHDYGGDPWDRYIDALANLPPEIAVLGINDYLFVDGLKRVQREHSLGNLPNIQAILPVVELRLDVLAGTETRLQRINFHVLFDESLSADQIDDSFVRSLRAQFQLNHAGDGPDWDGRLTRESLTSLGAEIRKTVVPEQQATLPKSDLELGFNNICFTRDEIKRALGQTFLHGRYLTSVGKTEWSAMKWSGQAIALKKDVISSADLVFVAAETLAAYEIARDGLRTHGVSDRLVDCSDAHAFADSRSKDRLGNCLTWVNADPTLAGLRHAITEFETRVFVGSRPGRLIARDARPHDFMCQLGIEPTTESVYFDVSLPLNPGFIAVIGNKGKGKSAFLDTIGLLGASRNSEHFSFLSTDRFRHPLRGHADAFVGRLTWCNGQTATSSLDDDVPDDAVESLTYLPQDLIDAICSPRTGTAGDRFSRQLGDVLFSHVPQSDRLGTGSLDGLIAAKRRALDEHLSSLREELASVNRDIATGERVLASGAEAREKAELAALHEKIRALDSNKPPEPTPPQDARADPAMAELLKEMAAVELQIGTLGSQLTTLRLEAGEVARDLEAARQLQESIAVLVRRYAVFLSENADRAQRIDLNLETLAKLEIALEPLHTYIRERTNRAGVVGGLLAEGNAGTPATALRDSQEQLAELRKKLDLPSQVFELEKQTLSEWQRERRELTEGSGETRGLAQVSAALVELQAVPAALLEKRQARSTLTRRIHETLWKIVQIYEALYAPARTFIDDHPLARECELAFGAVLREQGLHEAFFERLIDRGAAGSFAGVSEGGEYLASLIAKTDFADPNATVAFAEALDDGLHSDRRRQSAARLHPESMLRMGASLEAVYDLVFGLTYLEPHYRLEKSGVAIDQLSPGEKGTLLSMFYLLVDTSARPLVLDQPDENLDNQTIKDLLVPAIKEASATRQVVVVTHNPNVAIVADADQIILADFDGTSFSYVAGSIHEETMNQYLVQILEGTWPAFSNREKKYQRPRGAGGLA